MIEASTILLRGSRHVGTELGDISRAGQSGGGRTHALLDPVDNGIRSPSAAVLQGLALHEPLESGETLNSVLGANVLVLVSINLGENDIRVLRLELGGGFGVMRG